MQEKNKKIKLAFINVMDGYSGGEIVLQRLIRGLDKKEFDVMVYSKNTKFIDTLNCKEVRIMAFDTQYQMQSQRSFFSFIQALKLVVISAKYMYEMKFVHKIDIVHSNTLTSNIYFAIWAKLFRIKFIAHSHEIREGIVFNILHKYIAYCSDKIITVSDAVKENWLLHQVDNKKIITIYNGINDDFF